MDVIAWSVAFVVVAIAAQVQQVQLVNQALAFQQVERAIDRYLRNFGIDFLSAVEDFVRIEMAARGLHHLQDHAALAGEADAARTEGLGQVTRHLTIDALAGGNAMGWSVRGHRFDNSIAKL